MQRLFALALRQANNSVSAAARSLGVSQDYVRYGLSPKNPRELPG
jgi:hypothetical protein